MGVRCGWVGRSEVLGESEGVVWEGSVSLCGEVVDVEGCGRGDGSEALGLWEWSGVEGV